MLGLINSIVSLGGAVDKYIRNGLVMANRFTLQGLNFPVQGSAEFNGTSDYIQLDTPFSYTNHTIAAWVYISDQTDTRLIFDNRNADDDGLRFLLTGNENFFYSVNASDLLDNSQPTDEWIYFVGTYDGTTQKLYKNGSLLSTATTSQSVSTTTDATIGRTSYTNASYYKGNLANVAIWNRALSSDEINSVMWKSYDSLLASEKDGLQAWYRLQESELLAGDDTATLTTYAAANSLTFEGAQCVQDALNALPTADAGRVLFDAYDTRVIADSGSTEARTCTINELNAIL